MSDLFDEWGLEDDESVDDGYGDEDDLDDDELTEDDGGELLEDDLDELDDLDEEDEDIADELATFEDDLEDDELDVDPMDGALIDSVLVSCPYCNAAVELAVDPVGGDLQEYVEDCEVCCQPWSVRVTMGRDGIESVDVSTLDEA